MAGLSPADDKRLSAAGRVISANIHQDMLRFRSSRPHAVLDEWRLASSYARLQVEQHEKIWQSVAEGLPRFMKTLSVDSLPSPRRAESWLHRSARAPGQAPSPPTTTGSPAPAALARSLSGNFDQTAKPATDAKQTTQLEITFPGPKCGLSMLALGPDYKPVPTDDGPSACLVVNRVQDGSPALAAGLKPMSHQLVSVAGHPVAGFSITQLHQLLRQVEWPTTIVLAQFKMPWVHRTPQGNLTAMLAEKEEDSPATVAAAVVAPTSEPSLSPRPGTPQATGTATAMRTPRTGGIAPIQGNSSFSIQGGAGGEMWLNLRNVSSNAVFCRTKVFRTQPLARLLSTVQERFGDGSPACFLLGATAQPIDTASTPAQLGLLHEHYIDVRFEQAELGGEIFLYLCDVSTGTVFCHTKVWRLQPLQTLLDVVFARWGVARFLTADGAVLDAQLSPAELG